MMRSGHAIVVYRQVCMRACSRTYYMFRDRRSRFWFNQQRVLRSSTRTPVRTVHVTNDLYTRAVIIIIKSGPLYNVLSRANCLQNTDTYGDPSK